MRTNIEINDDFMAKVMNATSVKTKKVVIEKALQEFIIKAYYKI
jgi:Arc/MetJ family transcription regulator